MEAIEELAKVSIQTKLKELPSSQLMKVSDVADLLLDLQQELVSLTASSAYASVPIG